MCRQRRRHHQVVVIRLWTILLVLGLLLIMLSCHIDVTNSLSTPSTTTNSKERRLRLQQLQQLQQQRSNHQSTSRSEKNSSGNGGGIPKYITCSSSIELERAIQWFVKPTDTVLEFGSQFSNVSLQILNKVKGGEEGGESATRDETEESDGGEGIGKAIFVDIEHSTSRDGGNNNNKSNNKSGRCKHRNANLDSFEDNSCTIIKLPSLEEWKEHVLFRGVVIGDDTTQNNNNVPYYYYDVIVIDVGHLVGNDLYMTTLSLTNEILSSLKSNHEHLHPRVVLIKSKSLSSLARRLIPCQRLLDGSYYTAPSVTSMASTSTTATAATNVADDGPIIISSVGVSEYRRTIPHVVQQGNSVIEVGCHYGRTTALLAEAVASVGGEDDDDSDNGNGHGGICIGVDIGPKIIRRAQSVYPTLHFEVGDAWKTLDLLKFKFKYMNNIKDMDIANVKLGYDVVYADIGGLSGAYGTLESLSLIDSISNSLQPRCIVIKSLCMRRLATKLVAFSNIWSTSNLSESSSTIATMSSSADDK